VPRCTFSIYTYPDPGDPDVVAIDTVTSDLILTDCLTSNSPHAYPARRVPGERARLRAHIP